MFKSNDDIRDSISPVFTSYIGSQTSTVVLNIIAGFHVTSWRPCWFPITKHSSLVSLVCTSNMATQRLCIWNLQGLIANDQFISARAVRVDGGHEFKSCLGLRVFSDLIAVRLKKPLTFCHNSFLKTISYLSNTARLLSMCSMTMATVYWLPMSPCHVELFAWYKGLC